MSTPPQETALPNADLLDRCDSLRRDLQAGCPSWVTTDPEGRQAWTLEAAAKANAMRQQILDRMGASSSIREEFAASGADLIAAERRRQIEAEGYSTAHDDEHGWRLLWLASMAYTDGYDWPWSPATFKPTNVIRDRIKAGALAKAACEVAERAGRPTLEWYPAKGALHQAERFLDDVLSGVPDLRTRPGKRDS